MLVTMRVCNLHAGKKRAVGIHFKYANQKLLSSRSVCTFRFGDGPGQAQAQAIARDAEGTLRPFSEVVGDLLHQCSALLSTQ